MLNFTAFAEAEFEFVKGVNVYVGENGSGKTHVLKLLYALQKNQVQACGEGANRPLLGATLVDVFGPDSLGRLTNRRQGVSDCDVTAAWDKKDLIFHLTTKSKQIDAGNVWNLKSTPIFIPAKEILGHSKNFLEAWSTRNASGIPWLDFDVTYYDLIVNANPEISKGPTPEDQKPLLEILRKQMRGKVSKSVSGRFYQNEANIGNIEFPLVAEGWRKLGLLWVLILNGNFTKGNVLYWDEPEANLSPMMFPTVAGILARLAATGTQLHVASHSYAFLSELEHEVNAAKVPLKYFSLERTRSEGVKVRPASKFVDLRPNLILDEYTALYRRAMQGALGRG